MSETTKLSKDSGRFSPEKQLSADLAHQVRGLSADLGFGSGNYGLIWASSNAIFENPTNRVVARVASNRLRTWGVAARLDECHRLARAGAPLLQPLRESVFQLDGGDRVTFWPLADYDIKVNGADLADLALATHRVEPPIPLNEWRPQLRRPGQLASLAVGIEEGLPAEAASCLQSVYDRRLRDLVLYWQGLDPPTTLVHGDFSPANIVRLDGQLKMCDPDSLCLGPVEADLAKIKLDCQQLAPSAWEQFLANYDRDFDQPLLDKIFAVNQIGGLMWSTRFWRSDEEVRADIRRQIDGLAAEVSGQSLERLSPKEQIAEVSAEADYLAAELIESIRQLRSDQPHPGMVDQIRVGNQTDPSINELAVVELAGPQTLLVKPFDWANLNQIAAAISASLPWKMELSESCLSLDIPPTDPRKRQLLDRLQSHYQASQNQLHRQHQRVVSQLEPRLRLEANQIYQRVKDRMQRIVDDRRHTIITARRPQTSPVLARRAGV